MLILLHLKVKIMKEEKIFLLFVMFDIFSHLFSEEKGGGSLEIL